jgi:tetratricopeptide (TPR) repeat protein
MKMFDKCIPHIEKCISGLDWFHYAKYVLATALVNLKQFADALVKITHAIDQLNQIEDTSDGRVQELTVEYLLMRAKISYQLKDVNQSFDDFTKVIELDAHNIIARVSRGKLNLQLKNYDASHTDFDAVVAVYKNYGSYIHTLKARAYRQEKKFQEACHNYDKAFEFDKQFKDAYDIYECYLEKALIMKLFLKDLDGARDTYTQCVQRYPERAEPLYLRGKTHEALNESQLALDDYNSALTITQKDTSTSTSTNKLQSDIQQAIQQLKQK